MSPVLWRASYRFLFHHPWQLGLAILGVALGVAVIVSVDLARGSAKRAFDLSTEAVVGKATHRIVGGPEGLDESLYVRLRIQEGIQPLAPVLDGYATLPSHPGETLQLLGVDPFAETAFREYWEELRGDANGTTGIDLGDFFTVPGTALVSEATAKRLGIKAGERLAIRIGRVERKVRILGLITPSAKRAGRALDDLLITDISTAQELLGMEGRLNRIDLIAPVEPGEARGEGTPPPLPSPFQGEGEGGGRSEETYLTRIRAFLPPGVELISAGRRAQSLHEMTRAFHTNLIASSLLALLVGTFLIYNTMSFIVVQQRPLIGILRALGITRREVFQMILWQAMMMGILGTAAGILIGVGLGPALTRLVTRTINDIYFTLTVREISLEPFIFAKSIVLGLSATVAAAFTPAWEATSLTPRYALTRSQLESGISRRVFSIAFLGVMMIALGGGILLCSGKSLALGFVALFATILGCALLTPLATVGLIALIRPSLARLFGVLGRLSAGSVTAALSRTAVAIAALMVAIATIVGVGLMILSLRIAVADWLEHILRADLYVSLPGPQSAAPVAKIEPELARRLAQAPGIAALSTGRWLVIEMENGFTNLMVYEMAPKARGAFRFREGDPAAIWPAFEHGEAVLVSESYGYRHNLRTGDLIHLRTDRGMREFPIIGVYYEYGSDEGVVAMSRRTFERYWNDRMLTSLGIYAAPGVDDKTLRATVQSLLDPSQALVLRSSRAIREESMRIFDRSFTITEVLRLLATLIACAGVVSALMARELERTRELGILRACGVTPTQLWRLVITETGLMGFIAGLLALPVGSGIAALLVFVLNQRSFGWSMDLHVSPGVLAQGFALAVVASLISGIYPALKMARTPPAEALRME